MTTYAIQRTYGKHCKDYLHAWDKQYGTACIGAISQAMTFATAEEAQAARDRAAAECKTLDGQVATFFNWSVVPAYQHTPETCPICKGRPLPMLRIGRHTCNICGNTSATYQ